MKRLRSGRIIRGVIDAGTRGYRIARAINAVRQASSSSNNNDDKRVVNVSSTSLRKVKRGKRVKRQDPYECKLKIEYGTEKEGKQSVYVGSQTHPCQQTLFSVCQALVRFFAVKADWDFVAWTDAIMRVGANPNFTIGLIWQEEDDTGMILNSASSSGAGTWDGLVINLANKFVEIFGDSPVAAAAQFKPKRSLQFITVTGGGNTPYLQPQFYKANDLYITVDVTSGLQVHNRSPAQTTLEVGPNPWDKDNVFTTPLTGRYYTCTGGDPIFATSGRSPSSTQLGRFRSVPDTGAITTHPDSGQYDGSVVNIIHKPPEPQFFTNCVASRYVKIMPGQISMSSHRHAVTKSLRNWMYAFSDSFRAIVGKTYASLGETEFDVNTWRVGHSHFYGLENMCRTLAPAEGAVRCGLEINLILRSRASYKPRVGCVAQTNIVTS